MLLAKMIPSALVKKNAFNAPNARLMCRLPNPVRFLNSNSISQSKHIMVFPQNVPSIPV